MSTKEIDTLMALYDDIRNELLEEEAIWAFQDEDIVEEIEINQEPSVPCPHCSKPISNYKEFDIVSLTDKNNNNR